MATITTDAPTVAEHPAPWVGWLTGLAGLRVVLVVCEAIMTWKTWDLWLVRTQPPNLPLWDGIPQLDMGWLLLASLVVVLWKPRVGVLVNGAVLVAALAMDQMRLQPEWISLLLLMVATTSFRYARTIGWAHLASVWFWAGFGKLTSAGFPHAVAPFLAGNMHLGSHPGLVIWGLPFLEMGLGVLAAVPLTRRIAGIGGFLLHASAPIVAKMSWDWAILPWNVALAWASIVLLTLGNDRDRAPAHATARDLVRQRWARWAIAAFLLAYPALTYGGWLDLYLAHHLYANDGAHAEVCDVHGCSEYGIDVSGAAVNSTIPFERRLYVQWFKLECKPGQVLKVTGRQLRGPFSDAPLTGSYALACPRR